MNAISSLLACMIILGVIVGAFVFMFSPKAGEEIFKRVGIVLLILLFGVPLVIGLVQQVVQSLWPWWFWFFVLAVSTGAYLIRESLGDKKLKPPGKPYGAERTPVLPNITKDEEDSHGS